MTSLGVASLEQVVKEVTSIRLLPELGTLGELALAVGHVSRATGSQLGEQELVNLELVDNGHGAADEMARGGGLDQLQRKAVVGPLQHVEGLAKAEVAQDVHGQVVAPVAHVARLRPALGVGAAIVEANLVAKGADVAQDVALHLLHGTLGEGVRQDAALAGVDVLVARVVRVGGWVDKGIVELGLAHVGLEAVDFLEGLVGVEGDGVGAESNHLAWKICVSNPKSGGEEGVSRASILPTIFLVHAPELKVAVALVSVVELVCIGDFGQERTGIFGKGVEEDSVHDETEGLSNQISH